MKSLLLLTIILETIYTAESASDLGSCTKGCSNPPSDPPALRSGLVRKIRQDEDPETEPPLWGNPCNYPRGKKPRETVHLNRELREYAQDVALEALHAREYLQSNKSGSFATALYKQDFLSLIKAKKDNKWLQAMPWYIDEVLPEEKKSFQPIYEIYLDNLMLKIEDVLPILHKGNKMILAGLRVVAFKGVCREIVMANEELRPFLDEATRKVRNTLCKFSDFLEKLGIKPLTMDKSEEPTIYDVYVSLLVYRDAIDYLQYLEQVFKLIPQHLPRN